MKEVLTFSSESQGDIEVGEASRDKDNESGEDDRNKLMRAIRVNQILRENQTDQATPEMLNFSS